jgi:hypothetical protein
MCLGTYDLIKIVSVSINGGKDGAMLYGNPSKVIKFQELRNARIELSDQEFDFLCNCSDDDFIKFVEHRFKGANAL